MRTAADYNSTHYLSPMGDDVSPSQSSGVCSTGSAHRGHETAVLSPLLSDFVYSDDDAGHDITADKRSNDSDPLLGQKTPRVALAHAAYLFTQVLYGLFYVVVKLTVDGGKGSDKGPVLGAPTFAGLRLLVATVVLMPVALWSDRFQLPLTRRQQVVIALCGVFGVALNQLLTVEGVARAGASLAGLLQPLVPVLCGAAEVMLRRVRARWYHGFGLVLSVGGALVVLRVESFSAEASSSLRIGAMLLLAAVFVIATAIMLQRVAAVEIIPPASATAFSFLYGSLIIGPFAAYDAVSNHTQLSSLFNWETIGGVMYCGIVATALTDVLSFWALKTITPSQASVYICIQPFFATLFGALFLREQVTWFTVIGGLLIVAGLLVVVLGSERARRSSSEIVD